MNLTVPAIIALAGVFLLLTGFFGEIEIRDKVVIPRLSGRLRVFSGVAGAGLLAVAIWLANARPPRAEEPGVTPELTSETSAVTSKYSFEDGPMGWRPQDSADSRACVQVSRSEEMARKEGRYSLKMQLDIVGGDAHKSKGEAWVNMLNDRPAGETIPKDLTNHTVTAWVYAPQGSTGDTNRSSGFQLFVKDKKWLSEYGPWHNVVEGRWVQISLKVMPTKPKEGWVDQGFDPSQIIAVGVKVAAGDGSTARYQGPIYVDAVNW